MSQACDRTIAKLIDEHTMIFPAVLKKVSFKDNKRIPSYGLTSAGYDIRLQKGFKLFNKPNDGRVIDVMDFDEDLHCEYIDEESIVVPPGGLVLGVSVEEFNIPNNVMAHCLGKSTWARVGAIVNVTPLEPGWQGNLVVEITNGTNQPLKIYSGVGIAQITFNLLDKDCETPYGGGKYQNQTGIQGSKL